MTTANLTPILNDLKISFNTWHYADQLFQIILTTDLNQSLYADRDMVYFDSNNNTIKVKRFFPTVSSGFITGIKHSNISIIVNNNRLNYKFRTPKVGDFVYFYKDGYLNRDNSVKISKIIPLGTETEIVLTMDSVLDSGYISFMYTDLDLDSLNFTNTTETHYRYIKKQTQLIKMTPAAKSPYDIVYSLDFVSGLEMQNASEVY